MFEPHDRDGPGLRPFGGLQPDPCGAAVALQAAWQRARMESRLTAALQVRYPAVARLVGTRVFPALCRAYIHADPRRSAVIVDWGGTLPEFLEAFGPTEAIAFLPDVARLEWARWLALHAADARPISAAELSIAAMVRPKLLCLRLHPSVRTLASEHPVVSIWERKASRRPAPPLAGWAPEAALVARVGGRMVVERISPAAAAFVDALAGGATLAEARRRGRRLEPGFHTASLLGRLFDMGLLIGAG